MANFKQELREVVQRTIIDAVDNAHVDDMSFSEDGFDDLIELKDRTIEAITKLIERRDRDTIANFIEYAHKKGYLDSDWYTEEPFLYDEYFAKQRAIVRGRSDV